MAKDHHHDDKKMFRPKIEAGATISLKLAEITGSQGKKSFGWQRPG
jgi:hypothetical protein